MKPLVTIIIPTYNRLNRIEETLKSVENQTYKNWECIIVDDISNDNSEDFIKKRISNDNRFIFLKRTQNKTKGPSSCRNIGIENTKGQLVVFLDSDDLLSNDCLQNRVSFYLENPEYDFYIFKTQIFNNTPNDSTIIHNIELTEYTDENYLNLFLLGKAPFCIMSPLWKIETLKKLHGFDENLIMLEDPDLHIRAFLSSFKSKTTDSLIPDNFYRNNVNRHLNIKDKSKIHAKNENYYYFFEKHLKENRDKFKKYVVNYFKNEVLTNESFNFSIFIKFYLLLKSNNYFKFKQYVLIFPLTLLIYIPKLDLTRLKNYVFKN